MEDPGVTDRKVKRLRTLIADIDNVYFNIKSERHSYYQALLSLGDRRVAPRDRGRRAQRRQLARRRRRDRRRRRLLHLPRPQRRRRAALGHHRRRHEARSSARVRQGPARGVDAAAQAPEAENTKFLPRYRGSGFVLRVGLAGSRSRTRSCAVLSRSAAAARSSALAVDRVLPRRERHVPAAAGFRSHTANPISLRPSSGPSVKCSSASASFRAGCPCRSTRS